MFKNFKLTHFLNELAFGQQTGQQGGCNRRTNDINNERSHDMESFYQNFQLLQTKNCSKPQLKTLSKSQQFSLCKDFSSQHSTQSQIIYLKRKPSVVKFTQIGDKFYDHLAIKLQITNKQKQKLKQNLDRQLLMKQKLHSKQQNTTTSGKQQKQFIQLLFDYYFEDASSICSSLSYVYVVFQKWNEGILQILDQILIKNQNSIKEFNAHEDKNVRMRNTNIATREKKLSPINKIQSVYSSMYIDKSHNGFHHNNRTPQFQQIIYRKSTNPIMQTSTIRLQLARQLLKLAKNTIFGLHQQFEMKMMRSDLRISNFIHTNNYKLSSSLIPHSVLSHITDQLSKDYIVNHSGYFNGNGYIAGNEVQSLLFNVSYASPEELSKIITCEEQYSDNHKQNDLLFSSLLFKLGMSVLELWLYYQWRLGLRENDSKTHHLWISITDKVYVLDSLSSQFNNLSHKRNCVKIDWLVLSNLFKEIQGKLNSNDRISTLFGKVLRLLLNRSAVQRSKAQILLKDQQFVNIFKPSIMRFTQQSQINNKNLSQNIPPTPNKLPILTQPPTNVFQNVTISSAKNPIPMPIQRNPSNISSTINPPILLPEQFINGFYQKLSNSNSNSYFAQNFDKKTAVSNVRSASQQYVSNSSMKSYISVENVINNVSKPVNSINQNNVNFTTMTSFNVQNFLFPQSSMSFKTPQFKQSEIHSQCFKVNSVSQDEGKQLFSWNEQKKAQAQDFKQEQKQDQKDEITDPQTEKGNSQQSLSEMPDLLQESPIKKKPSSLSNQPEEVCELPSHLPQSSKLNSVFNTGSVVINDNKNESISIKETHFTNYQRNQDQPTSSHQNPPTIEVTKESDNTNKTRLQMAMRKIQADQARQFQSKQYIDTNFHQPHTQYCKQLQSEYVSENYTGGGSYQGYVKNKKRNGYGKLCYQDGSKYEGEWLDDQMNGYGKLYYSHGMLAYDGNWVKDQFHGTGKVYNDTPKMLDGLFDYTDFNNLEEQWIYYQGELQHDLKQGHGIIMLENGEYFEGDFYADRINGQGKFVNLEGETIHGIWRDNVLTELIEILEI